jgi:hypothetical protein
MDYKLKYLKYKQKYINLKNYHGGSSNKFNKEILENELVKFILDEISELNKKNKNDIIIIDNNKSYLLSKNTLLTWDNIKNQSVQIKQILFDFRKKIVDTLIKDIFDSFPECLVNNNKCISNASGSVGPEATLDSDYDLTIAGHYQVSIMIQIFNSVIEKVFKASPSEVFDTNLYGYSFLIPPNSTSKNRLIWEIDQIGKYSCLFSNEIKSYEQDEWAYLRLFSFCYKHNHPIRFLNEKINKFFIDGLFKMQPTKKANNYILQMKEFENLINTNTDLQTNKMNNKELELVKKQVIDSLSNMNYYGDETYFTQGAFIHVVGTMFYYRKEQNYKKVLLFKSYYLIHSMIENLAYFIHAFEKKKSIIYAVKYYHRFFDAFNLFIIMKELNINDLNKLLVELDFMKSKLRNRTNDEILQVMNDERYYDTPEKYILYKIDILNNHINSIMEQTGNIIYNQENYYIESLFNILIYCINNDKTSTNISITNDRGYYEVNL